MVPENMVIQGEPNVVVFVDALSQICFEVAPVDVVLALELHLQLVDEKEHLNHLVVLHMLIRLNFNRLVALRAQLGVIHHQLVDAGLAKDNLAVLVITKHRCSRKELAEVAAEVFKENSVHLDFPRLVRIYSCV